MDMRRLVGENVRRIRQDRGLTQEQFADLSGFSQQYLSGLERGRRNPTVVTLFELATALKAQPVELLAPIEGTALGPTPATPKKRRR
jgi:transcriptional regulator with XRE-family HTH domain